MMFNNVKSDPLDVLLFTIGLRLSYLAKSGDAKFKSLLENRNFSIQLGSELEQIYRTFSVNNGYFTQTPDKLDEPNLTITFKDSMTGVKLLTKGDATAFMVGIQNGDLKMAGDYSLLMWFNQVAKFIVPKVPEKLQPVVEQAKPIIAKATPFAKELFAKANDFFAEKTEKKSDDTPKSKFFNEENTPTVVDDLKGKVAELKEKAEEKFDELKTSAEEKVEEIKTSAEEKLAEIEEKVEDLTAEKDDAITENLTPAQEKSQELEAKHSDDEIIAENVKTEAVKSDESPITNITVTRNA